jgi:hypothetical protein
MANAFCEQAWKTWLCAGCHKPRVQGAIDLSIQEDEPDNTPLNMVSGCTVGIARKEFLFSFGEDIVRQHLYLGRLFGAHGTLLEDWVTLAGRDAIIVRGTKHVTVRRCSGCGSIVYFAMAPHYLYPQPPEGIPIFHACLGRLVVREELARRVTLNRWRRLDCTELPVLDAPEDGLGDLTAV